MGTTTGIPISSWRRNARCAGALLSGAALLLSAGVGAQETERTTALRLGVIHTDNVELADEGLEESQNVLEVSPTFGLLREANRLSTAFNYRAQGFSKWLIRGDIDGPRISYCIEPRALRRLRSLVGSL